ncbi:MAG: histidine phosphatase family protein [Planctomycetes bacterium]|nr:histidine phosphatase family protein [Planctomycetota bacterium]
MLSEPTDFCRLWLFRHPELDPEHTQRAVGDGPADLSRRGRAQVLRWLEVTKPMTLAAVWSSPQPQCHGPARALAEARQQEALVEARLRDQALGRWQGRAWSEVMREEDGAVRTFFAEFGEAKAPGGESLGDAVERMLTWWQEQMQQALGKSMVVVLPGTLLSGFAAAMLGMRLARSVTLALPAGGIGALDVFMNGSRVACWNLDALRE